MNRVPIVRVIHQLNSRDTAIRLPPCIRPCYPTTRLDAPAMHVFHALTPFDDREPLDRGTRSENRTFFLRGFKCHLDRFR